MPPQSLICWPESLSHTCPGNITDRRLTKTCWEMDSLRANLLMSNHWESQISANTLCWLAPAGINCKQWIDMNTKGSPQITSIKEPSQKQHLAESFLGYTSEGSVLWGLSGERMGDVTRPFQDDLRHEPWCSLILNGQHQDPGVLAQLLLHFMSLPCVSPWGDQVWKPMLTGPDGPGLRGFQHGGQVFLSSPAQPPHTFSYFCPDDK